MWCTGGVARAVNCVATGELVAGLPVSVEGLRFDVVAGEFVG